MINKNMRNKKETITNEQVIKAFLNGASKGNTPTRTILNGIYEYKGNTLRIEGNKLVNYNTTIAKLTARDLLINADKYSITTSKIQNKLKSLASGLYTDIILVNEDDINN